MKVAITVSNLVGPAGNETFGIPSAGEQEADYQEVINALNASGGVACRKLVPVFFEDNPADQSNLEQVCLEVAAAGVFAELDPSSYAYYSLKDCYPQNHIPYFTSYIVPTSEMQQSYPYMFAFQSMDNLYRDTIFGLRDRGFFGPTSEFRKLGFVYRDCYPSLISEMRSWLSQAGVSPADLVTYDVGCPAAYATPGDLEQAVLKFRENGVTNLTTANFVSDFANFTLVAQQQGFHPKYGLADDALISTSYGSNHPDYNNLAGAVSITESRFGEERTPGMGPSAATQKCDGIYRSYGRPPTYQQKAGFAGYICDELWMFAAAVQHAPLLQRTALAAGLQASRSVDFSWPEGPNDFAGTRVTYGGQNWRVTQFVTSCNCWQVLDPAFHPSYG